MVDRVEIWAAERWEALEAANGDAFDELEHVLTGNGHSPPASETGGRG